MSAKATVSDRKYLIERKKKDRNGYHVQCVYTGSARNIPKGWRMIREVS